MGTRRPSGGPGDLKVKATRHRIQIQHFSGKIKAGNLLGFHGSGINLLHRNTALGDNSFFVIPKSG